MPPQLTTDHEGGQERQPPATVNEDRGGRWGSRMNWNRDGWPEASRCGPPQRCWPGGSSIVPLHCRLREPDFRIAGCRTHMLNYPRYCGKRNEFLRQFYETFLRNWVHAFAS